MSAVNRALTRHWPVRFLVIALALVLPGAFSFVLAWVDDALDRREYERERRVR